MDPSKDKKAEYLLRILETIGAPLMSAITEGTPPGQNNPQNEAQIMATLLGKTVEASIELGQMMQIDPAQAQDDTLRVALAGLASPLVAGEYANRKRIPESPEIKKITSALQSVLTFSDNFTPTPQTIERLQNLEAKGQAADTYQTQIQYMQAFIPVVEAIAQFPFGQAEAKLLMDVSDRIIKRSVELRETLLPNVDDEGVQKLVELGFVRALGQLYCACHKAETEKATGMDQDSATSVSIDAVWKAFDLRTAMLEALAAKMVPAGAGAQTASSSGGPSTAPASPPQEQAAPTTPPPAVPVTPPPAETQPPAQPPAAAPPPAQTPPPVSPPPSGQSAPAGANPMSLFAKKPQGGEDGEGQAAAPPAAPPPQVAPQAPPQVPPAAPPVQPPPAEVQPPAQPPVPPPTESAQQPPVQQPTQTQGDEEKGDQDQQGQGGGNPMSFFKKGE